MTSRPFRMLMLIATLMSPAYAFAYLDPGTGSALIQGLIAAIAAIGVSLKLFWHRILAFFGGRKTDETSTQKSESESESSN